MGPLIAGITRWLGEHGGLELILATIVLGSLVLLGHTGDHRLKKPTIVPAAMAIMRSVDEIDREGVAPRKVLMRQDVAYAKRRGITVVYRSLED